VLKANRSRHKKGHCSIDLMVKLRKVTMIPRHPLSSIPRLQDLLTAVTEACLFQVPSEAGMRALILASAVGLAFAASTQAAPLGPTSIPAANVVTVQGWPNWQ
jgi:hypothetical protein